LTDSEGNKEEPQDELQDFPLDVSRERVESLWRQILNQRSSARGDLATARASRAKAEMERQRIANEALESTKEACRELIGEAERQLAEAHQAEAEAQKKLAEAEKELEQAQAERADGESYRSKAMAEADSYRDKSINEAQQEAQRIREEARSTALQECADLKRHVTYEVQAILTEIDAIRAAAQEELEAQRIYAETANLKTMTQDIRARVMQDVDKVLGEGSGLVSAAASTEDTGTWEATAEKQESVAGGQLEESPASEHKEERVQSRRSKAKSSS